MKFSVSSKELLKTCQTAAGALNNSPVLPIMEDFLFSVKNNLLTVTATDLEISISNTVEVQADKDYSVAIPAKILQDTLKALPEQPIRIEVNEDNYAISITSAYGKYKLAGENAEDFPETPSFDTTQSFEVDATHLAEAVSLTTFCCSNDDLRPAMTGVFVEPIGSSIRLVATDAHQLAMNTLDTTESKLSDNIIIPRQALEKFTKNITTGQVIVETNQAHAKLTCGDFVLVTRLIDARYPGYKAIIPNNDKVAVVPSRDLHSCLKRVGIFANTTTNQTSFTIENGMMTIQAQDLDFSNEAQEILPCQYSDEKITIGFNAKLFANVLAKLDGDIHLKMSEPNRAGLVLPADSPEWLETTYLIMPVMLGV